MRFWVPLRSTAKQPLKMRNLEHQKGMKLNQHAIEQCKIRAAY